MFRKMLPKYAIFSTFLSKIVLPILHYLLHIFWLLFSFYSIGLLVTLETNVTCIRLKYIKRTPCVRPKFVPRFCVNLLCLLFTLLAAIGWQTVNLPMNQTVKYQGAFSRITGFSGKRFFSPPPPPLRPRSSFDLPFLLLSRQLSNSTRNTFWWRLIDLPWPLSYCPILELKIDFNFSIYQMGE